MNIDKTLVRNRSDAMNILITDYHCASNRGDAAILEGELAALQEEFPDAKFTVMTEYPDAAEAIHGIDAVQQRLVPFESSRVFKNGAIAYSLLDALVSRDGRHLPFGNYLIDRLDLEPYYEADLVVSTGGHYITDIYMPAKLGLLVEFELCKHLKTPVVLYAQSIGPFENTRFTPIIRRVLNNVNLITTRDEISAEHLKRIGVDEVPVHCLADAAFSLPLDSDKSISLLFQEDKRAEQPDIQVSGHDGPHISISVRHWSHFGSGSEQAYFKAIAEAADWLVRNRDARILFASTCTSLDGYHRDDRLAAQEVISEMDEKDRSTVSILTGEYTPQQLVDIYEEMDLHIGTRMHSVILSILGGTVPVPIGYQFKTRGTMKLFDLEDHVLDIDELDASQLCHCVEETLEGKNGVAEQIKRKLPEVRESSRENARLIRRYVSEV